MTRGIVSKRDLRRSVLDGKRDVSAASLSVLSVVLIPAFVDRHFALVAALGNSGSETISSAAVRIFKPGTEAGRVPVSATSNRVLVVAGYSGDDAVVVVCDPVAFAVEVKTHRCRTSQI